MHILRTRLALLLLLVLAITACQGNDAVEEFVEDRQESAGEDAVVEVAEEYDAEWASNAVDLRSRAGERFGFKCPPGGEAHTVWGTSPYTDDSSVCTAAVHAGLITFSTGGTVVIEITEGLDSYDADEANGVTTSEWPQWPGSFVFPVTR